MTKPIERRNVQLVRLQRERCCSLALGATCRPARCGTNAGAQLRLNDIKLLPPDFELLFDNDN
jgi:hypothetical protein